MRRAPSFVTVVSEVGLDSSSRLHRSFTEFRAVNLDLVRLKLKRVLKNDETLLQAGRRRAQVMRLAKMSFLHNPFKSV